MSVSLYISEIQKFTLFVFSMTTLSERDVRVQKVADMSKMGVIPYYDSFVKQQMVSDLLSHEQDENFRDINEVIAGPSSSYVTAGRVMLYRTHGKISFVRLLDETGQIQLMFHAQHCFINCTHGVVDKIDNEGVELSAYKFLEKFVDMGDFIGVKGELFKTHKGELTLFVSEFTFLSKALQPLGDKFHGVNDQEILYRKRYLDMIMNPETLQRMKLRCDFIRVLRQFYRQEGFVEVETPVLGNAASGAAAQPFVTHHNDYDLDVYLRISPETALKKSTVGMFEKVFEVAKDFRNEGTDPSHLQEFTMVEHYAAYWTYKDNMAFTEKMFQHLFSELNLPTKVTVKSKDGELREVDFGGTWPRIDFSEQVLADSGIDIRKFGPEDEGSLKEQLKAQNIHIDGIEKMGVATIIDYLYKKVSRPKIAGPAFLYNYPKVMQPLARVSDSNPNIVEQFQVVVNGWEIIKAYSELVDPLMQQANFDEQAKAAAKGDDEATKGDSDFVQAMEHGMPPQSGFGMGIDRLLTLLTGQDNLRDVVLFPLLKPEE